MKNRKDPENEPAFTNKKRKKHFTPYKKDKYSISKLEEYENYLNNIELLSKGGNLET
jgi:hypothetical protein